MINDCFFYPLFVIILLQILCFKYLANLAVLVKRRQMFPFLIYDQLHGEFMVTSTDCQRISSTESILGKFSTKSACCQNSSTAFH